MRKFLQTIRSTVRHRAERLTTPRKRVVFVSVLMALIWGAIILCQGSQGRANACDWALMSEVGRGMAVGDTLYVDAIDQKGPLCYATYALVWLVAHTQVNVFVVCNLLIWLLLSASSLIVALIVEEAERPWAHPLAQALLSAVIFTPHVGCVEEWLAPFGLLSALWVLRLARGKRVPALCWIAVGLVAAFALWAKFTCCAQLVFLVGYAASREHTKGLGKAVTIALLTCALASAGVLWWMHRVGSFDGMMQHYVHAASDGYAERMSMLGHLTGGNPSSTHVTSFVLGALASAWAIVVLARNATRKLPVVLGALLLVACCFATFVGYYRFQLATLVVLAACDASPEPWRFGPVKRLCDRLGTIDVLWTVSALTVVATAAYACIGTIGMYGRGNEMRRVLHETVGDDASVMVWTFGQVWAYGELGLDYPYPIPARYNASQDLWDETAAADVAAHKWRYIVLSVDVDKVKVGDTVVVGGRRYTVRGVAYEMAVADGRGGDDALECKEYRLP